MSYANQTLLADEKIVLATKPHYIIFSTSIMWLLLSAIAAFWRPEYVFFAKILVILAAFNAVVAMINYHYSEYVITNKRILVKVGFIHRRSLEIFLDKIEAAYIDQNIVGRLLKYGTVVVTGIGGTKDFFRFIPDPLKFRSLVQQSRK